MEVADAKVVSSSQQLMIISADGIIIRTPAREKDPKPGVTSLGRNTQGMRLMRLGEGDRVAIVRFDKTER